MIIGLSQRILLHKQQAYDALDQSWYKYLQKHSIVAIANRPKQNFEALAEELDAYIITGGDDSTERRITEIRTALTFMKRQKPIIGICHGAFLLTDILGGKIVEVEGHSNTSHEVNYFGEILEVNSYHTQTIKIPHKHATLLANDDRGNCEAWIDGKMAGIVWHPERMTNPWIPEEIEQLFAK
jgi:GMP synthase-like glutamine amidotransferase